MQSRWQARSNRKLLICGNELKDLEIRILNNILGVDNYEFILRPTNRQLNIYYNSVNALIYPSSYEGFGIPVVEAQKAGCPVIALNSSSIPEVIGETPLMLDDLSERSFKKVNGILDNYNNRQDIIKAGLENSQRFSWEKMGEDYMEMYNSIL